MRRAAARTIACAAAMALALGGCMHSVRLKERAIVQAVGVDRIEDDYRLTILYFTPEESGEKGPGAGNASGVIVSRGPTMSEAVEEAARLQGRQVFFGSNKLILLGRKLAEEDVSGVMSFFGANHQLHPSMYVLMALDEAQKLLEGADAAKIFQIAKTSADHRRMHGGTMLDVAAKLADGVPAVDIPILRPDGKDLRVDGAGLIQNGRLAAELTQKQAEGLLWLTGEAAPGLTTLTLADGTGVSLEILSCNARMRPSIGADGRAVFDCSITADASIRENLSPGTHGRTLAEEAERLLQSRIAQLCHQAAEGTALARGADVCGLTAALRRDEPDFYRANRDKLEAVYRQAEFHFKIQCNISRLGLEAAENKG